MKLVVFVSGRGSNLNAILNASELKGLIDVVAVFSDKVDCKAFEIAKINSIKTYTVGNGDGKINLAQLASFLIELKVDLIVLAGYLKLIPTEVVTKFENKIVNIHPALLPSFGGNGMYGMNVHKAVFNSGVKVSGVTVHLVDNNYDTGKIIAQRCVDISGLEAPEAIAEEVLKTEHKLLPEVIKAFAENKIKFDKTRITIIS